MTTPTVERMVLVYLCASTDFGNKESKECQKVFSLVVFAWEAGECTN